LAYNFNTLITNTAVSVSCSHIRNSRRSY